MKKTILLFGVLFLYFSAPATNYFFAVNGKASASGLSHRQAISDIHRITTLPLKAGDTVFFRRGDVFRGSFVVSNSGRKGAPIVFAAYGQGALPVISGSEPFNNWQKKDGNVWQHRVTKPVMDLFADRDRQTVARYPNNGFLRIDSGVNKNRLFSRAMEERKEVLSGATIRLRTIDWVYEMRQVTDSKNGWLEIGLHPAYKDDRGMWVRSSNSTTTIYNLTKGYGFYLDGLPQFLDSAGEWVMNAGNLLYKSPSSSPPQKIEGVVTNEGITLANGVQHIVILDLHLTQFFSGGIKGGEALKDIAIERCQLTDIHNTAISVDSGSVNTVIRNCVIADVTGKGIALLEAEGATIEGCTVRRIGLLPGYGFTGVNGGTAISITNIESKIYRKEKYSNHNTVRRNNVDSCGYNGIRVDGSYNLVEENKIQYCGLTLNDGSALYCFAAQPGITHSSVFRRNIVLHSQGNIAGTPANAIHFNGIYIDNNSHDMLVEGNTSAYHSSAGMVNNDASFQNTFRNNIIYDCGVGAGFAEWGNLGKIKDCKVEGNTIVSLQPGQHLVEVLNFIGPQTRFALFANNTYLHTARSNGFRRETKQLPQNSKLFLSFPDWQRLMQTDSSSLNLSIGDSLLTSYRPELLTNDDSLKREYKLVRGQHLSFNGEALPATVVLPPFHSLILLKKKD